MKRLLSIILIFAMLFTIMPNVVYGAVMIPEEAAEEMATLQDDLQYYKVTEATIANVSSSEPTTIETGIDGITLTLGSDAYIHKNDSSNSPYTGCIYGSSNPKVEQGIGTYFEVTLADSVPVGEIVFGYRVNVDKAFYITVDGIPLDDYNGITYSENTITQTAINVEGGHKYAIYALGTKLRFYGFSYREVDEFQTPATETPIESVPWEIGECQEVISKSTFFNFSEEGSIFDVTQFTGNTVNIGDTISWGGLTVYMDPDRDLEWQDNGGTNDNHGTPDGLMEYSTRKGAQGQYSTTFNFGIGGTYSSLFEGMMAKTADGSPVYLIKDEDGTVRRELRIREIEEYINTLAYDKEGNEIDISTLPEQIEKLTDPFEKVIGVKVASPCWINVLVANDRGRLVTISTKEGEILNPGDDGELGTVPKTNSIDGLQWVSAQYTRTEPTEIYVSCQAGGLCFNGIEVVFEEDGLPTATPTEFPTEAPIESVPWEIGECQEVISKSRFFNFSEEGSIFDVTQFTGNTVNIGDTISWGGLTVYMDPDRDLEWQDAGGTPENHGSAGAGGYMEYSTRKGAQGQYSTTFNFGIGGTYSSLFEGMMAKTADGSPVYLIKDEDGTVRRELRIREIEEYINTLAYDKEGNEIDISTLPEQIETFTDPFEKVIGIKVSGPCYISVLVANDRGRRLMISTEDGTILNPGEFGELGTIPKADPVTGLQWVTAHYTGTKSTEIYISFQAGTLCINGIDIAIEDDETTSTEAPSTEAPSTEAPSTETPSTETPTPNTNLGSGTCGDNLTWVLDSEGTLTISGTGEMWDWVPALVPWSEINKTIQNIVIEEGVTTIGNNVFFDCINLINIDIPSSITSIGERAFYNSGLKNITIPSGVESIGRNAFSDSDIINISIPDSVTSLGSRVFNMCKSLISIDVDENNPNYCSVDGVLFNKNKTTLICFPEGKASKNYIIPNSVTRIDDYAFMEVFGLTNVIIPDGVESIGQYAFGYCYDLINITIPRSVAIIEFGAFGQSNYLTDVYYTGTEEEWAEITIDANNECLTNATIHYNYGVESHTVTYNYAYNGGTSATKTSETVTDGNSADLTPTATKSGWTFVGWNTSPSATTALSSYTVTGDVTLYAIYKKILTAKFYSGNNSLQTTSIVAIYNNATSGSITAQTPNTYSGWTVQGWRDDTTASANEYSSGASITLTTDKTFYAVYSRELTLSYNANGGSGVPSKQTVTQYYNANGTKQSKTFIISSTKPTRSGYAFLGWSTSSSATSATYQPNSSFTTNTDTTLYAVWSKNAIPVESVSLDKTTLSLNVGESATLTAIVLPSNATNKSVSWTTSNSSIATVSASGVVTAKSAGTAVVTVTTVDGAKVKDCIVTVTDSTVYVSGVMLDKADISLNVGETQTLTATVLPTNATNKNVTWNSSNTNIATVSANGVVTALADGVAVITVKSVDGNKIANCTVTVKTQSSTAFTMKRDNYSFANRRESFGYDKYYTMDFERYEKAFGLVKGTLRYNGSAITHWNGSCFGMTATAGLFYNNTLDYKRYDKDAESVYNISAPANKRAGLTKIIELYQLSRYIESVSKIRSDRSKKNNEHCIEQLVAAVQEFEENEERPMVLCVYGELGRSHALLPYRCEKISNDIYHIYVYDCNTPNSDDIYVEVDCNKNRFKYESQNVTYSKDISYNFVDEIQMALSEAESARLADDEENTFTVIVNSGNVVIQDAYDYADVENIDGAFEIVPIELEYNTNRVEYVLPNSEYTIRNNDTTLDKLVVSVANSMDYQTITTDDINAKITVGIDNATGKLYLKVESQEGSNQNVLTMDDNGKFYNLESEGSELSIKANKSGNLEVSSDAAVYVNGDELTNTEINREPSINSSPEEGEYIIVGKRNSLKYENGEISGNFSFAINNSKYIVRNARIITALYTKSGKLVSLLKNEDVVLGIEENYINLGALNITNLKEDEYHIKVFMWDSIQSMEPLTEVGVFAVE